MKVSWEQGFDQRAVVERLLELVKANNAIGFPGGAGQECLAILRSMLHFDTDLPWETKNKIIERGTLEAVKSLPLSPQSLLTTIQRTATAYHRQSPTLYVLHTSINAIPSNAINRMKVDGVGIGFGAVASKKVRAARQEIFSESKSILGVSDEPNMLGIRASIHTRSIEEVASRALDAIDLVRGILNFLLNHNWRRTLSGARRPANQLLLGPLHTVHTMSGSLVSQQFWYEPNFSESVHLIDLSRNSYKCLAASQRIRKRLAMHRYRAKVESALIRYARALDSEDHDIALVRLWSLLEFLTDTGHNGYDVTVKRARFLVADASFAKLELEHLRRYRNRSVHAGQGGSDVEVEMYQLKKYVENAIRFHISNKFGFGSLSEACAFLDLPTDKSQLQRDILIRRDALRFIG